MIFYSIIRLKFMNFWPYMNYVTWWKILHNGLMVNKSSNLKTNMSISQILNDFDIDEKSLHGYVKDDR